MKEKEIKYSIPVKLVLNYMIRTCLRQTTRATLKMTVFQRYVITTSKLKGRKYLQRLQLYDES